MTSWALLVGNLVLLALSTPIESASIAATHATKSLCKSLNRFGMHQTATMPAI
jgi:hypothetical protein